MKQMTCVTAVFCLSVAWPVTASGQVSWSGVYAGADVSGSFRTLHFTVSDLGQPPALRVVTGAADFSVNLGGHAGFDSLVGRRLVLGGEVGFGTLGYRGEARYGVSNDTFAETDGGFSWTAMARVGYVYRQVMPYFSAGITNSKNTAHVVDDCSQVPCGNDTGEGSGTASATRWALAFGAQFASTKRIAGRGWSLRLEWMQVQATPLVNGFSRTQIGIGLPQGRTVPVEVSTNLPHGLLRVLFDLRLTK